MGVENVYEYEPAGVGGCGGSSGGCVALISSGTSHKESAFLEATPSGNDVFFLTAAQLAPAGHRRRFDIYDARECTRRLAVSSTTRASARAVRAQAENAFSPPRLRNR